MVFDLWEIEDFIGVFILISGFGLIGLCGGYMVGQYNSPVTDTIQAQPLQIPLLQPQTEGQDCNKCLDVCLNIYTRTRQFGKTIYGIENGFIK